MLFAKADIILKSQGVFYTPPGGDPTPVAFHPELYGEGLARHHPFDIDYGKVDPATGQYATLTHHPAGMHGEHEKKGGIPGFEHEHGGDEHGGRVLWPIEAVAQGIVNFIREKGYDGLQGYDFHNGTAAGADGQDYTHSFWFAWHVIQEAIEGFNANHKDSEGHGLPNIDSPEWRQVTMGAFPKNEENKIHDSTVMPTRDEQNKLITFFLNSGTTMGQPERGPFPESGSVPFYTYLKDTLNKYLGRGMSMDFVHQPYVEPHLMNPMMSREHSGGGQRGLRTTTPQQEKVMAEDSHWGEVAPELFLSEHPDIFFLPRERGGRKSGAALHNLRYYNDLLGWGLGDDQLKYVAQAPIAALMTPGQKISSDGAYAGTYHALGQASGIYPGHVERFGKWKKGKVGTPEELKAAYAEYVQDQSQHNIGEHAELHGDQHSHARRLEHEDAKGAYGMGTIDWGRNALAMFAGANKLGVNLNDAWNDHATQIGDQPLHPVENSGHHSQAQFVRDKFQQMANHRIANQSHLVGRLAVDFSGGHPEGRLHQPELPPEWQSIPSPAIESTFTQTKPVGLPNAVPAFDDNIRISPKVLSETELRLLKAMEEIQLADAQQDSEVLKLLPRKTSLNINNHDDVMVVAQRLELTPIDIHSINASQGDWSNVAKTLQVPPSVVGSVKVAFRG